MRHSTLIPLYIGYCLTFSSIRASDKTSPNIVQDIRFAYQGAIEKFKNKWYFFYNKPTIYADGTIQRSIYVEVMDYYENGLIKRIF